MANWTKEQYEEYKRIKYRAINSLASRIQMPLMECPVRNEPLAETQGPKGRNPRVRASITLFTRRPLDDCNLSTKALIDCVRYAGIIIDDNWSNLEVKADQRKVETEAEEGTEITITKLREN